MFAVNAPAACQAPISVSTREELMNIGHFVDFFATAFNDVLQPFIGTPTRGAPASIDRHHLPMVAAGGVPLAAPTRAVQCGSLP
jgi:hypothetical protein